ncbi:MAG: hypothetical protein AB8G99_21620 [Planctomycetaceae bacterium]
MSTPITSFRATTMLPFALRNLTGGGWSAKKSFRVVVEFARGIDASRYEYRQYIKGTATIQRGSYRGATPRSGNWTASGPVMNSGNAFSVPGGLTPNFKEDGQVIGGRTERYGYRSNRPTMVSPTTPEDRYLPAQANGRTYRATDFVGLTFVPPFRESLSGLRVRQNIIFQGRVIDTARSNRTIKTLHWSVRGDVIIP